MINSRFVNMDYAQLVKHFGWHNESGFHCIEMDVSTNGGESWNSSQTAVLRDAMLLMLCRKGSIVVMVGGSTHVLVAGQMLLIFAGVSSRFTSVSADFACSIMVGRINMDTPTSGLANILSHAQKLPVVSLLRQENQVLTALMRYVEMSSANYRSPSRSELDEHILAILRGELIDIFLRRNLAVKEISQDERLVQRFSMMLAMNCAEHRDVEFYARECGIPAKRFASKVKRITGKTPSELISLSVIRNAKQLLTNTQLTTTDIASKLNFPTPSFFCRYFKRYVGLSPQEWRSQLSVTKGL